MALLFIDGFDHYATADIGKKWTNQRSGYPNIQPTSGRRGGGACFLAGNGFLTKTLSAAQSTVIIGYAYKPNNNNGYVMLQLSDATAEHLSFTVNSSYQIVARRGDYNGTVLGTSSNILSNIAFQYVELKVTIGGAGVGAISLQVNGVADAGLNLIGINTSGGGSVAVSNVNLGSPTFTGTGIAGYYDDLYIANTSGAVNNTFFGDCRVDTLFPNADGNYSQFTPSTGTSHFANVDDATPNTTDYNSSATKDGRDSYGFTDLSTIATQAVYGVQINAAAVKSDAGTRSLGMMSRLAGVDKDGAGSGVPTTQTFISEIQETSPAGAAWTEANVNAAEFGVKVTV